MIVYHERLFDCSAMEADECGELCLVALQHGPSFKLKADSETDIVNGSLTIVHASPPELHQIWVEVYDVDSPPDRATSRESALKRPAVMPTEETLKTRLDTLGA